LPPNIDGVPASAKGPAAMSTNVSQDVLIAIVDDDETVRDADAGEG
jgi:hypothetical protein